MLAFVLLAQVAAASPSPTPEAALGTTTASVSAKPRTLADLARERKLGKKGVAGTLSVSGASGMPEVPAGAVAGGRAGTDDRRARVRAAQADVEAARRALDDEAVKKGMTSENAALARKRLADARRELSEAREAAARARR